MRIFEQKGEILQNNLIHLLRLLFLVIFIHQQNGRNNIIINKEKIRKIDFFLSKNVKFGTETPHFGKIRVQIGILSTHNLLWIFQLSVGKLDLPDPPIFNLWGRCGHRQVEDVKIGPESVASQALTEH